MVSVSFGSPRRQQSCQPVLMEHQYAALVTAARRLERSWPTPKRIYKTKTPAYFRIQVSHWLPARFDIRTLLKVGEFNLLYPINVVNSYQYFIIIQIYAVHKIIHQHFSVAQ